MAFIAEEIDAAVQALGLTPREFRKLPDSDAQPILVQALERFVGGDERRWWWENFTDESVTRRLIDGWRQITTLVPDPQATVWFIAEDSSPPHYPVYEGTPHAIEQVIGECVGFEYYLIAKDMSWLLCENHHDCMIAVGAAVTSRLAKVPHWNGSFE